MSDVWDTEAFVNGIPKEMSPFAITDIKKLRDTAFDIFLDIVPAYRGEMGFDETPGHDHDFRIFVTYNEEASILSLGVIVETLIPPNGYGWALDCLNQGNMFGNGYVSKLYLPDPKEGQNALSLVFGWEVGVYDTSLLSGEGLKTLTKLVHGIMLRLCVEVSSISVDISNMYQEQFPSGKIDS